MGNKPLWNIARFSKLHIANCKRRTYIALALAHRRLVLIKLLKLIQRLYKANYSASEIAATIEKFLDGELPTSEWDSFLSVQILEPGLNTIRGRCLQVKEQYPSLDGSWCNEQGEQKLRELISDLRSGRYSLAAPR